MATRSFGVGGSRTDTKSERIVFRCAPTATNYDTLENAGVNYQVPAGQTLIIDKISFFVSAAGTHVKIGHGTAAVDVGAAPAGSTILTDGFIAGATNTQYEFNVCIPIPADKYPYALATAGNVFITLFGHVSA